MRFFVRVAVVVALVFIGVGVVSSAAVASVPREAVAQHVVDAKTWKQVKESPWCSMLRAQPKYSYTYQGATITVPSGARLLKYEIYGDGYKRGSKAADRVCKVLVKEYRHHRFGW